MTEVLDELSDHARGAQQLRDRQDEIGRCGALRHRACQLEADDLGDEHRDRLAEHRRLGLDAADSPAEHTEPVDHRRVRIRADERVRERLAVSRFDDAREKLEVDLVDDACVRWDDLEVVERRLSPAQKRVALAVTFELELGVAEHRARRRVLVHLHRVVDDELGGKLWIDSRRVAPEVGHRIPHPGEIDDRRHTGEVLQQDAGGSERDLFRRLGRRLPASQRPGVPLLAVPECVLEQDPQGVGESLGAFEPEDLVAAPAGAESGGAHPTDCMEPPAVPI